MSKARARFTESDIGRILKAAAKAHVDVRVKIDVDGGITIATGKLAQSGVDELNPWDEVLGNETQQERPS
jgi:hypothetical protein